MNSRGLLVRMHAKHGSEKAVEDFLHSALPIIEEEPNTMAWFAVRFGRGEYGIFDVFPDDAARESHLAGPIGESLRQRTETLFDTPPQIHKLDVLAEKIPVVSPAPDTKGLLLTFKAKPGHEQDVEDFLRAARELAENEHGTTALFATRSDRGEYGIFDVFPGNEGRFFHLVGSVPRELAKHAFTLLGSVPEFEMLNVQAEKIGSDVHDVSQH